MGCSAIIALSAWFPSLIDQGKGACPPDWRQSPGETNPKGQSNFNVKHHPKSRTYLEQELALLVDLGKHVCSPLSPTRHGGPGVRVHVLVVPSSRWQQQGVVVVIMGGMIFLNPEQTTGGVVDDNVIGDNR